MDAGGAGVWRRYGRIVLNISRFDRPCSQLLGSYQVWVVESKLLLNAKIPKGSNIGRD